MKHFLATELGKRVQLEGSPGYAPARNSDVDVWQLKRVELRHAVCHSRAEREHELRLAVSRLRHEPHVLRGCFAHCGYAVSFFMLRSVALAAARRQRWHRVGVRGDGR